MYDIWIFSSLTSNGKGPKCNFFNVVENWLINANKFMNSFGDGGGKGFGSKVLEGSDAFDDLSSRPLVYSTINNY